MINIVLAFLCGICLLISWIGFGGQLRRGLFPETRSGWALKAAWGMAFYIFIGGLLNAASLISAPLIVVVVGAGILCWAIDFRFIEFRDFFNRSKWNTFGILGVLLVSSVALVQYTAWLSIGEFNPHDDFHGYLVFSHKMLQTGSLGVDLFNFRLHHSPGAQLFLHATVLSMLSDKNLYLVDPGLCLLIISGLLAGYLKEKRTGTIPVLCMAIFPLLLSLPKVNISAMATSMVLFLSLFVTLEWLEEKRHHFSRNAIVIALVSSGLCALKATIIPASSMFVAISYLFYLSRTWKREAVYEAITFGFLVVGFLLPWMLSSYQSTGTLLFPWLGKGNYDWVTGHAVDPLSWWVIFRQDRLTLALAGFIVIKLFFCPRSPGNREASLSIGIAAIVGSGMLCFGLELNGAGKFFSRLAFPTAIVGIMASMAAMLSYTSKWALINRVIVFLVMMRVIATGNGMGGLRVRVHDMLPSIAYSDGEDLPLIPKEEQNRYLDAQRSIPERATILARLQMPFQLNFRRNNIYVVDVPGMVSPQPGMPFFDGPEELREYLLGLKVRYLMHTYKGDEISWLAMEPTEVIDHALTGQFEYAQNRYISDFEQNLADLRNTTKRIYDDGNILVLDLKEKLPP